WKCYYDHQSVCFHQVSSTTKNIDTKNWVKQIYYRNRFLVHAIHLEGLAFWSWYLQVFLLEVVPKLLIGKFWIWKSFRQFVGRSSEIAKSKRKLDLLMNQKQSDFTLFEVKKIITQETKGRKIIWLKFPNPLSKPIMKTYFCISSFAKANKKYSIPYVIFSLLGVIFSTLNLALLAPLLSTLFGQNEGKTEAAIKPESWTDILGYFNYYAEYAYTTYGPLEALK